MLKKLFFVCLFLFCTLASIAVKPVLKKAEVIPGKVKVGEEVTFILTFTGNKEDIKSIKLYNLEFPYDAPVVELIPDTDSKENIWKAVGPIPYEAPAGIYNWEIKAIDQTDHEIIDKDCKNQSMGKTGKLKFEVI